MAAVGLAAQRARRQPGLSAPSRERAAARQLDRSPAALNMPMDYPAEALCLKCGQPIRVKRWFLSE
jgi:hypothetical protein